MTKKIKILRNAELRAHRPLPGTPNLGGGIVQLRNSVGDREIDLVELPKKICEHTKYEVRLKDE